VCWQWWLQLQPGQQQAQQAQPQYVPPAMPQYAPPVMPGMMSTAPVPGPLQQQPTPASSSSSPTLGAHQIPGVTDRRHEGVIVSLMHEKGFGFIRSPELRLIFPTNDIFLHRNQMLNFKQGDAVTFSVFMNRTGKPNANELQAKAMTHELAQILQRSFTHNRPPEPDGRFAAAAAGQSSSSSSMPPLPPPVTSASSVLGIDGGNSGTAGASPHNQGSDLMQEASATDDACHEVVVPNDIVAMLVGEGAAAVEEIRQRVGGDVRIDFAGPAEGDMRALLIRGPSVSAGLAACLLLERASDII